MTKRILVGTALVGLGVAITLIVQSIMSPSKDDDAVAHLPDTEWTFRVVDKCDEAEEKCRNLPGLESARQMYAASDCEEDCESEKLRLYELLVQQRECFQEVNRMREQSKCLPSPQEVLNWTKTGRTPQISME